MATESTATDTLLELLDDSAHVYAVTRGVAAEASLYGAAAAHLVAWRELASALDAYAACQRTGRMPGRVIDRVSAARAAVAELDQP